MEFGIMPSPLISVSAVLLCSQKNNFINNELVRFKNEIRENQEQFKLEMIEIVKKLIKDAFTLEIQREIFLEIEREIKNTFYDEMYEKMYGEICEKASETILKKIKEETSEWLSIN